MLTLHATDDRYVNDARVARALAQYLTRVGARTEVDAMFDRPAMTALTTMDNAERERLLREAGRIALERMPVLPIHSESSVWDSRRGFRVEGRMDQRTLAQDMYPA